MFSALRKIGNSTGLVLPKPILGEIGLQSGATLDLTVEGGRLIGTPVTAERRVGWAAAALTVRDEAEAADWHGFGNDGDDALTW